MDHSGHANRSRAEKMMTIDRDIAGDEKGSLKQPPQIKARADGFHRRSFDDTSPSKDARGIRRLRRTLGKKATMTELDDRGEPDIVPRFGLLSDEETVLQCNTSCTISLTEDASSQNDGGSVRYNEINCEANVSVLSSDFAIEALPLNDCEPVRLKGKGVRRKDALPPVHTGRDIWPIQEIMSTDSDDLLVESDPQDEDDLVPVETNERRRGFQLPKLRIQKRAGPRHANDSPVARLTKQPNVAVDGSDSTQMDRLRTPTVLRHRKPFGTTTAKSPLVSQPESTDDKDHETRKGLRISRGRKPPSSPNAASAIAPIPQKPKVSESIMGKLRKGLAQEWKDLSGYGENDGASSWEESDSDDSDRDGINDDLRADSTVSGSRSLDYDDAVLHAADLLNMDVCEHSQLQ
ncbi:hypothetical protein MHU86_11124 [Fragilaria crotonensis]|nr:hypothetical protein MHU86_11124 [Fragilaria crotonensis]